MKIIWTARAISDYDSIILYLLDEWTLKEAQQFIRETNRITKLIAKNPNLFEASDKIPYLRKGRIGKQTTLIYQIDETEIVLLTFIDNRRDHSF
jgi:plasmid stabilization system protein ParE